MSRIVRTLFIIATLLLCVQSTHAETLLRSADVHPRDYPTVQSVMFMSERLQIYTNGELAIKVYPSRQLGEEQDTLLATMFGAIDINRVSVAALGNIAQELRVLALPYLFTDVEHQYRVLRGPIGDDILAFLEPHGLIGLAFLDSGARSFYTREKPIRSLADLQGLKIRVQNTDLSIQMMDMLGANATPMSFGQVYESLITGVIDGAENNWPSYVSTRHFEAAPYYTLDRHTMIPEIIVMSKRRWLQLTPEQQVAVKQAAREASLHMETLWNARVSSAREKALAAGVTVIELDNKTNGAFAAAVSPLYREYKEDPVIANILQRIHAQRQIP